MTYWDDGHMGDGWGVVMVISMLVFWALTAFTIGWFLRTTRTPPPPAPPQPPGGSATSEAEQILAERLARGDIELEDYQARVTALKASR